MKAPAFAYLRPDSMPEALAALASHGDDAQVLAGGQSLTPMLNLRLARPAALIDVNRLQTLRAIAMEGETLVIGALATHAAVGADALVREHAPLLAQAAPFIAHHAIRNRGTIGGSLALADPAAEWPACCLALGAEIELESIRGVRRVPAEAFFQGLYATDRAADELLTAVRIPTAAGPRVTDFGEIARRRGDFAIAGAAIVADAASGWRIAMLGVADRPYLATGAMAALNAGGDIAAATAALGQELAPPEDPAYPAAYRRQVAQALLARRLKRLKEAAR